MEEDELREVLQALVSQARAFGWEGLFERPLTPVDARTADIDVRSEVEDLIHRLRTVAVDLQALDTGLWDSAADVATIGFKPEYSDEKVSAPVRGFVLARGEAMPHRQAFLSFMRNLDRLRAAL